MKTRVSSKVFLIATALVQLMGSAAHAELDTSKLPKEQLKLIDVPGGKPEICMIPRHLEEAKYSKKDLENEEWLCTLKTRENTATCPKLESSNPGLNFHEVPAGVTRENVVAGNCFVPRADNPEKNAAKKVAKYKLSTSCSYAPSLITYYHISRILGDIGNVPVAVLRTFDFKEHVKIAQQAQELVQVQLGSGQLKGEKLKYMQLMELTWKELLKKLSNKDPVITEKSGTKTYGALQKNPRGETRYEETRFDAPSIPERIKKFKSQYSGYRDLMSPKPVTEIVGSEFTQENVQRFLRIREVSELILLDTLLNQEDRFGTSHNIHAETEYFYQVPGQLDKEGNRKIKSSEDKPADPAIKAVEIKKMMLKDNDCGVGRKGNTFRELKLIEDVAHMNPKTYKRLLDFSALANAKHPDFIGYLKTDLRLSDTDIASIGSNLKYIVDSLKKNCRSGRLKLDLDLEAHFSGHAPTAQACE